MVVCVKKCIHLLCDLLCFLKEIWFFCPFHTIPGLIWAFISHLLKTQGVHRCLTTSQRHANSYLSKGYQLFFKAASTLFNNVFRHYGIQEDVVSDRSPQLFSRVLQAFFKLLGVSVNLSILKQTARLSGRSRNSGGTWGPTATRTRTAGANSFHGWSMPRTPYDKPPQSSSGSSVSYNINLRYSLDRVSPRRFCQLSTVGSRRARECGAHVHLQRAVRRHKKQSDTRGTWTPCYHPGQKVWLSIQGICLHLPCCKLASPRYIERFTVQRHLNEVTYRLNLPQHYRISPSFHVSLLKPHTDQEFGMMLVT